MQLQAQRLEQLGLARANPRDSVGSNAALSLVRILHCHSQFPHLFDKTHKRPDLLAPLFYAILCPPLPLAKFHQTGEQPTQVWVLPRVQVMSERFAVRPW